MEGNINKLSLTCEQREAIPLTLLLPIWNTSSETKTGCLSPVTIWNPRWVKHKQVVSLSPVGRRNTPPPPTDHSKHTWNETHTSCLSLTCEQREAIPLPLLLTIQNTHGVKHMQVVSDLWAKRSSTRTLLLTIQNTHGVKHRQVVSDLWAKRSNTPHPPTDHSKDTWSETQTSCFWPVGKEKQYPTPSYWPFKRHMEWNTDKLFLTCGQREAIPHTLLLTIQKTHGVKHRQVVSDLWAKRSNTPHPPTDHSKDTWSETQTSCFWPVGKEKQYPTPSYWPFKRHMEWNTDKLFLTCGQREAIPHTLLLTIQKTHGVKHRQVVSDLWAKRSNTPHPPTDHSKDTWSETQTSCLWPVGKEKQYPTPSYWPFKRHMEWNTDKLSLTCGQREAIPHTLLLTIQKTHGVKHRQVVSDLWAKRSNTPHPPTDHSKDTWSETQTSCLWPVGKEKQYPTPSYWPFKRHMEWNTDKLSLTCGQREAIPLPLLLTIQKTHGVKHRQVVSDLWAKRSNTPHPPTDHSKDTWSETQTSCFWPVGKEKLQGILTEQLEVVEEPRQHHSQQLTQIVLWWWKRTPVYNRMPVYKRVPVYNKMPVYNSTPVCKRMSVYNRMPVYNRAPVYNRIPVYNRTVVYNRLPVYNRTPVYNRMPVYTQHSHLVITCWSGR